jgi:hypothetical protein
LLLLLQNKHHHSCSYFRLMFWFRVSLLWLGHWTCLFWALRCSIFSLFIWFFLEFLWLIFYCFIDAFWQFTLRYNENYAVFLNLLQRFSGIIVIARQAMCYISKCSESFVVFLNSFNPKGVFEKYPWKSRRVSFHIRALGTPKPKVSPIKIPNGHLKSPKTCVNTYTTGRKFNAPWVVIQYLLYVK